MNTINKDSKQFSNIYGQTLIGMKDGFKMLMLTFPLLKGTKYDCDWWLGLVE